MPDKETPEKKSKIVQVITTDHGRLVGVLYANGRVFFWTYTKLPGEKEPGEGVLVGDDVSGFRNKTDIRLILVDLGCPSPKLRAHLKSADSLLAHISHSLAEVERSLFELAVARKFCRVLLFG
jgi:hypothetical protein